MNDTAVENSMNAKLEAIKAKLNKSENKFVKLLSLETPALTIPEQKLILNQMYKDLEDDNFEERQIKNMIATMQDQNRVLNQMQHYNIHKNKMLTSQIQGDQKNLETSNKLLMTSHLKSRRFKEIKNPNESFWSTGFGKGIGMFIMIAILAVLYLWWSDQQILSGVQ